MECGRRPRLILLLAITRLVPRTELTANFSVYGSESLSGGSLVSGMSIKEGYLREQ